MLIAWIIFVALMCCCEIFYIARHHESKDIGPNPDKDERPVSRLLLSAKAYAMRKRNVDELPKEDSLAVTDLESVREAAITRWIYLFTEIEFLQRR